MKVRGGIVASAWEAARRELDGVLGDLRAILNGGLSLTDQSKVRTFIWNDANAAPRVSTGGAKRPLALLVLCARATEGGDVISGAPVTWRWDGTACVISAIGGLSTSTDYTVTLWISET